MSRLKSFIFGALFLMASYGFGHVSPFESVGYSSMDQAAIAGLQESYKDSNRVEYGGGIYQNAKDHKYYITPPYTSNSKDSVFLNKPLTITETGYTLVGDYHTHPCYPHYLTGYFSPQDTYKNLKMQTVGYILSECSGNIYRFDPSQDEPYNFPIDDTYITAGHQVGWIEVTMPFERLKD